MSYRRQSGILLHPTSLPGPFGMGEIGAAARAFVDRLAAMGQSLWQVLPLGPTGYGDSPYQSLSSFAGNPLLLAFDDLLADGLLDLSDLAGFPPLPDDRVDFGAAIGARARVLRAAADRFAAQADPAQRRAFDAFCAREAGWLEDMSLFMALKHRHDARPWTEWDPALARREPAALEAARAELADLTRRVKILQFLFARQWARLRAYARRQGVRFIGDVPIFVAHDSADVWARPALFHLDEAGQPTVVAGVPPDYFSATGQRWGNPLYRWEVHRADGYRWWIARLRRTLEFVDLVRLDHFRGFEKYWEVPVSEPTAARGRWVEGPGAGFLSAVKTALGGLPIIAEDLGIITPEVEALRDGFRLPGMRILQFATHELKRKRPRRPERCRVNRIIYTGTHDNDTIRGWFTSPPGTGNTKAEEELEEERRLWRAYLGDVRDDDIPWAFIRLAWRSPARMAVAPLQDVLGLGSEARMNLPGTAWGNWQWRFRCEQVTKEIQRRLRDLTASTQRLPRAGRPAAPRTAAEGDADETRSEEGRHGL